MTQDFEHVDCPFCGAENFEENIFLCAKCGGEICGICSVGAFCEYCANEIDEEGEQDEE